MINQSSNNLVLSIVDNTACKHLTLYHCDQRTINSIITGLSLLPGHVNVMVVVTEP